MRADDYPVQDPLAASPTTDQPIGPAEALAPEIHITEQHPTIQQQGYDLGKVWRPTDGVLGADGIQRLGFTLGHMLRIAGGHPQAPGQNWAILKEAHANETEEMLAEEELEVAHQTQQQRELRQAEQMRHQQQQQDLQAAADEAAAIQQAEAVMKQHQRQQQQQRT